MEHQEKQQQEAQAGPFQRNIARLRDEVKELGNCLVEHRQAVFDGRYAELSSNPDHRGDMGGSPSSERIANLTLAFRHLEDCRMRLGKAMQAAQGEVSLYDRMSNDDKRYA